MRLNLIPSLCYNQRALVWNGHTIRKSEGRERTNIAGRVWAAGSTVNSREGEGAEGDKGRLVGP